MKKIAMLTLLFATTMMVNSWAHVPYIGTDTYQSDDYMSGRGKKIQGKSFNKTNRTVMADHVVELYTKNSVPITAEWLNKYQEDISPNVLQAHQQMSGNYIAHYGTKAMDTSYKGRGRVFDGKERTTTSWEQ